MTHTDDALTEAVAKANDRATYSDPPCDYFTTGNGYLKNSAYLNNSRLWSTREGAEQYAKRGEFLYKVTVELIGRAPRAHDEQAALNCGHCTPNTDEIACACQIKERDDE